MTDNTKPANASTPAAAPAANPQGRKKGLTAVAAAVVVAAIAWGGYHWMVSSNYQTTDNAYVGGNVVQITPQVGGTVTSIGADDTDFVKPGLLLVQLDTADALVALSQAESQLAQIVRQTRTLYANNAPLMAQVAAKEADLSRLKAEASRTADDVARRRPLTLTGAVGQEEFHHAQAQAKSAQDAVVAAQAAVTAARAQLVPGWALVHDWLDLDRRIGAADLVLTGEGRFDATSLSGKGPGALALAAVDDRGGAIPPSRRGIRG